MTRWSWLKILLAALAYIVICRVSQRYFSGTGGYAFVWPPSGFMLAMFLLYPRREWPLIALVFFLANTVANALKGNAITVSLGFGVANTVESLGAALLMARFLRAPFTMTTLREVLGLLGLAAIVSNAVTALAGAAVVNLAFGDPFVDSWRVWWICDSVGMLLVTPVILTWRATGKDVLRFRSMTRGQLLEATALIGGMTAVSYFVFNTKPSDTSFLLPFPYATFPFLLWAAVRFGPRGGAVASLVVATIAVWYTARGEGPFAVTNDSETQRVLSVQVFLSIAAMCSMMLAAVINERRRAEEAVRSANVDLEERIKERTLELARSNAELEQFAYAASHDLQEPLRAVAGTTQILRQQYQGRLDAGGDQLIGFAIDGVTRMQSLINDLLAYSRIGAQGEPAKPCDCTAIVKEAMANLATSIGESGAAITYDGLPTLNVNSAQMVQLFQNLIGNAIKFRSERPPEIHIKAERTGADMKFTVRDNGLGIEPQYFEQIFGLFKRLHSRKTHPGSGIGLAICKKIVERQGGQIWVESELGRGTSFYFTVPAPSAR
jgi:signal transduction histidine kinase